MVLISGIGKIGKTELAKEFAYRCRNGDLFTSIIFIDASTPSMIYHGFRQVAKEIGLDHIEDDNLTELSYKVLQWFDGLGNFLFYTKRSSLSVQWLLIFDGASDDRNLHKIWAPHINAGTGRILVTSRNSTFGNKPRSNIIMLGPLDDGEANHMLRSLTHANEDLSQVVACWDGTPLTLAQVPSLVPVQQQLDPSDTQKTPLLSSRRNGVALSESLNSQFSELPPSASALLSVISFFRTGSVRLAILWTSTQSPLSDYPRRQGQFNLALSHLMKSSLVTKSASGASLQMLQLVQVGIQDRLEPDIYNKALATAISLMSSAWRNKVPEDHRASGDDGRKWIHDHLLRHVRGLETLQGRLPVQEDDFFTEKKFARLIDSSKVFETDSPVGG